MGCGTSTHSDRDRDDTAGSPGDDTWSRICRYGSTHSQPDRNPAVTYAAPTGDESEGGPVQEFPHFAELGCNTAHDNDSDDGWYSTSAVAPGKCLRGSTSLAALERGLRVKDSHSHFSQPRASATSDGPSSFYASSNCFPAVHGPRPLLVLLENPRQSSRLDFDAAAGPDATVLQDSPRSAAEGTTAYDHVAIPGLVQMVVPKMVAPTPIA
jgi:hypothetical protein